MEFMTGNGVVHVKSRLTVNSCCGSNVNTRNTHPAQRRMTAGTSHSVQTLAAPDRGDVAQLFDRLFVFVGEVAGELSASLYQIAILISLLLILIILG